MVIQSLLSTNSDVSQRHPQIVVVVAAASKKIVATTMRTGTPAETFAPHTSSGFIRRSLCRSVYDHHDSDDA